MRIVSLTTLLLLIGTCRSALASPSASQLLRASGVPGGLVVHLGCGDGQLTAELHAGPAYLVVGLDSEPARVQQARQHIQRRGLYGPVSADAVEGSRLPLVDDVVNLVIVSEDPCPVSAGELARVLAPGGVALAPKGALDWSTSGLRWQPASGLDGWVRLVKPVPRDIDEWSHFLHGPDNNAVAADRQVGPPRHLQWMADPMWSRYHHTLASLSALVTSGGRIFYVLDEGPSASIAAPPQWMLCARDAFSGVLLWKRPITAWASHTIRFRSGPVDLPRRVVATSDSVYATLARGGPVLQLDAATGRTRRVLPHTEDAEEIIVHQGVVLVVKGIAAKVQVTARQRRRGSRGEQQTRKTTPGRGTGGDILALDAAAGRLLWQKTQPPGSVLPLTLAAAGQRVFYQGPEHLVCLSLKDGSQQWRAERQARMGGSYFAPTLVVADDVVLSADTSSLEAFDAASGKQLWECPARPTFRSPVDVFVIDGVVWIGPDFAVGRDVHTGQVKQQNRAAGLLATVGHHHRCYRDKATVRYIIDGYRGMEFYDLQGDEHSRNNWVRGICQYGILPANGLSYAPPHACGCYPEALLSGFYALSAKEIAPRTVSVLSEARLQRGPAYGKVEPDRDRSSAAGATPDDWPTFRHDPLRSGSTSARLPQHLGQAWKTQVGGKLSSLTAAGGKLLVASIDRHTVYCFDAETGQHQWSYTVGGRVDSPPTLYRGLVLFGSADGYVYCLRAADGQLVWRFLAAPSDMRTVVRDQPESVWPVHGSLLVLDGIAYVAAGRSSWLDGGIRLYGLDPLSGQVRCQTTVASKHPDFQQTLKQKDKVEQVPQRPGQNKADWKTVVAPDRSDAFSMDGGTLCDVLVSDGQSIYMKQVRLDRTLQPQPQKGRHLYSTSSLLDDNENHRSHWMLGTFDLAGLPVAYSWIANRRGGRNGVAFTVPYGLMLSFDQQVAWCVWRSYGPEPPTLVARGHQPLAGGGPPQPDFGPMAERKVPTPWTVPLPVHPRAMVHAGNRLLVAGWPLSDPAAASVESDAGALVVVSVADGTVLHQQLLPAPPVWDGMIAARQRVYLALADGTVLCLAE